MEEKKLVLADTDVLIEFLDRANEKVKAKLLAIGFDNICISEITASELFYGAQNKKHKLILEKFISRSLVLPVTKEISNLHLTLVRTYSLSHKLKIQDALIAATALCLKIDLYTFNAKDFKFIKGIKLYTS
jgi:predicted nucleic acid-binding protein